VRVVSDRDLKRSRYRGVGLTLRYGLSSNVCGVVDSGGEIDIRSPELPSRALFALALMLPIWVKAATP
jgi:hypothetical protein